MSSRETFSRPRLLDDPEKDALDTLTPLPVLPVSTKAVIQDAAVGRAAQSGKDEQRADLALAQAKKEYSPADQKPKRRASRWIRFQLWFNTYKYVRLEVRGLRGLCLQ